MNQNLKTVVTLGGTVDSSFTKIGSAFQSSMGKATKSVKELERDQRQLTKQIRKSKLAGADVSLLTKRYQELSQQLDEARDKAEAFEGAAGVGSKLRGIGKAGVVAVGGIWATTTAIAGLMTVTNNTTSTMVGMAKAYDMNIERFNAWNGVAQQAGLDGEHIGDMIEELSNKFGEFKALGEQSSVADVFGALGINESMMEGMAAADQFEFIMKRLEGVADKQQAASLADMLFGGEGNKVTTYIRNTGKSLSELLDEQRQFNLLTEKGADGAVAYGQSFKNLQTIISSGWQEISGIVGGEMAGDIQQLSVTIGRYVRENKEAVSETLKSLVYGAKDFTVALWNVGATVNRVVQIFGGWETVGTAVSALLAGKLVVGLVSMGNMAFTAIKTIGALKVTMASLNVVMAANPIGALVAAVGLLIFAGIELWRNWDSVWAWFGEKIDWFQSAFPNAAAFIKTAFDWSPLGMIINNWSPITEWFSGLWGGITGIFDAGLTKISGIWDTVSGWMDAMKFWENDSPAPQAKSYHQVQSESASNRAMAAINNSYPASRGHTFTQSVGEIKVYAAPGQSAEQVGRAVQAELSGYRNSALYDLPEAG
ncbi:phage tail protein [Vibrio fluvialis]|uniref:phage tail protein n=1 Tax=Vibrio fluvialis TaxID=676 RepID=UPI0015599DE5|nr:phage tail protein [Vibrio fluvialis]EKO3380801.1 phage tail protein [Vibrio fluvialis]MBY7806896.1 phage tail protein [Vibrio fluvialis]MBY8033085.1 phage tail protein [Vibrio fluvialis]